MSPDLDDLLTRAERTAAGAGPPVALGRVCGVEGCLVRVRLPEPRMGDWVELVPPGGGPGLPAEITGFDGEDVWCSPAGPLTGLGPRWSVRPGLAAGVRVCTQVRGRVLDGLGRPLDDGPPIPGELLPYDPAAPSPLSRPLAEVPFVTGLRAIDGLCTLVRGQRVGLFAGSGVGKSHLMGQLARQAEADVTVVCLVGERGREVVEFLHDNLRQEDRASCVLVVATSDQPALVRALAPLCATSIAEWFRDRGDHVLLLVDSLTRMARALREIHLQMGQPPARRGYPPSVFAGLPRLLERAGTSGRGSITGVYTVLVEGDDLDEPVADEVRGLLDGHLILSRELAEVGHYPALDVPRSISRMSGRVLDPERRELVRRARSWLGARLAARDLVRVGAVVPGADPLLDEALAHADGLDGFCRQGADATPYEETWRRLADLAGAMTKSRRGS
jgi:FliI/YscN family ATPase